MAFRWEYWSHSKVANLIRGYAEDEWVECSVDEMFSKLEKKQTFRERVADSLDTVQNIVFAPRDAYDWLAYKSRNILGKSHVLSTPKLKLGQWSDLDYKLVECIFNEFERFITVEKAWMMCLGEHKNKWKRGRSPELGLAHLRWEIELGPYTDCDGNIKPNGQAESAKWQLACYNYITVYRPMQINPYDDFHYDRIKRDFGKEYYKEIHRIEEENDAMDTKWLTEIIQHRKELWT